jgi:hypothetical protein
MSQQYFDYFQQKLADIVDQFVAGFEMFLELNAAALDDFIIKDEFALDWIIGHEIATGLKTGLILLLVSDEAFWQKFGDCIADVVVLLEDGGDGGLDSPVAGLEQHFLL